MKPDRPFLHFLCLVLWIESSTCNGNSRPLFRTNVQAAAIFGLGGNKKDSNNKQQQQQQQAKQDPKQTISPPVPLEQHVIQASQNSQSQPQQIVPPTDLLANQQQEQQPRDSPPLPPRESQGRRIPERINLINARQQQQVPPPPETAKSEQEQGQQRGTLVASSNGMDRSSDTQQQQQHQQKQPNEPNQQQQQPSLQPKKNSNKEESNSGSRVIWPDPSLPQPPPFWADPSMMENGQLLPPPPPLPHGWMDPSLINGGNWMFPPPFPDWPPPPPLQQGQQQQQQLFGGDESLTEQQQQQQQFDVSGDIQNQDDEEWMLLQRFKLELDDAMNREQELLGDLENVTASLASLQQRDELQRRQLDVLMERIIDVETDAATTRNKMAEYQANCTVLGRQVAELEDQLKEWQQQCQQLQDQHQNDELRMEELSDTIKTREQELEELATAIETSRLREERDKYLEELSQKRKHKFGWLGFFFSGLWGKHHEDDIDEKLKELAKSTLLRALQTERNNVDELEIIVASLQQNNSAISQMVESRELIIEELNDRVAVFEEDKMVLKAALRQLQKEMNDETPKTQKLVNELENSRTEVERLSNELESLILNHQQEITALQAIIFEKQAAINETESNMTVIGTYVDKLEERLASFAVARRDIDVREQKCQELEESAARMEKERDELRNQVAKYTAEHDDMKTLLAELVQERSLLQQKVQKLEVERNKLILDASDLQEVVLELRNEKEMLESITTVYKSNATKVEDQLVAEQSKSLALKQELENVYSQLNELNKTLGPQLARSTALEEELKTVLEQLELLNKTATAAPRFEVIQVTEPPKLQVTIVSMEAVTEAENEDKVVLPAAEALHHTAVNESTPVSLPVNPTTEVFPSHLIYDGVTIPEVKEASVPLIVPIVTSENSTSNETVALNLTLTTEALNETGQVFLSPPLTADTDKPLPVQLIGNETLRRDNITVLRRGNVTLVRRGNTTFVRRGNATTFVRRGNGTLTKPKRRFVPLRKLRKAFAKTTGIHGFFTPSTTYRPKRRQRARPKASAPPKRPPQLGEPNKQLPKRPPQPGELSQLPKRPLQAGDLSRMPKRPLHPGEISKLQKRPPFQQKGSPKFSKRPPPPPDDLRKLPKRPLKGEAKTNVPLQPPTSESSKKQ